MPDFKPIMHTKDAPVEEPVIDLDQTDTDYDLVKPHSDNDNELDASREMDELVTHVQQHPLVDSDRLNGMQIFAQGIIWLFILFTGYSAFQYKYVPFYLYLIISNINEISVAFAF